jgi:hypothetical protein
MSAFLKHVYLRFLHVYIAIGFWYFMTLMRTFYACFHMIINYEGIDEHIIWSCHIRYRYF